MECVKDPHFLIKKGLPIFVFQILYLFLDKELIPFFKTLPLPFPNLLSWLIASPVHLILWTTLFIVARITQNRQNPILFQVLISQLFAICFSCLFKALLGRARPELFLQRGLYGFYGLHWDNPYHSFPSAHTLTAFTLATSLSLCASRFKSLFFFLAILTSLSRLSLGKHYLSDLFGSAVIGISFARFVYSRTKRTPYETS